MSAANAAPGAAAPAPVPTPAVITIATPDALDAFLLKGCASLNVVFFYADFHTPSLPGGQLDGVVSKLAELHPGVRFGKVSAPTTERAINCARPHSSPRHKLAQVDAEALADVADQFDVSVVPTFVLIKVRLRCVVRCPALAA